MREMNIKGIVTKIVLGALLAGAVWIAAPKTVRADILTYNDPEDGLGYEVDAVYAGKVLNIVAKHGSDEIPLLTNAPIGDRGLDSCVPANDLIGALGNNRINADALYEVKAIISDAGVEEYLPEGIMVYVFNPSVEAKGTITSPNDKLFQIKTSDGKFKSLKPGYYLHAETTEDPYYIEKLVNATDPTDVEQVADFTYDSAELLEADYIVKMKKETFSLGSIVYSPNKIEVHWGSGQDPDEPTSYDNGIYPYKSIGINPTMTPGTAGYFHTLEPDPDPEIPWGGESIEIDVSGSGTFTTTVKVSRDRNTWTAVDVLYPSGKSSYSFNAAETVKCIKVYKIVNNEEKEIPVWGDTISVKGSATYKAVAYLDEDEIDNPAKYPATIQKFKWTKVDTDGVINSLTVSKDTKTAKLTANANEGTASVKVAYYIGEVETTFDVSVETIPVEALLQDQDKITVGNTLDLQAGKGAIVTDPESAASGIKNITYEITNASKAGTLTKAKTGLTGKTASETPVELQAIVHYVDTTQPVYSQDDINVYVVEDWADITSSDSSDSITFKWTNDEVYTGNNKDENLEEIVGYRVAILKGDEEVWRSSSTTKMPSSKKVGDSITIEKSTLNDYLKSASDKLSGDSTDIKFAIIPYGKNMKEKSNQPNVTAKKTTGTKTVYKNNGTYSLDKTNNSGTANSSKTTGTGANGGNGLDKVPKTGEGNTRLLIIMTAVIFATIAGSILLSYMPAKSAHGIGHFHTADSKRDAAMQGFFGGWKGEGEDKKTDQIKDDEIDPDDWSRES
ncbi:MAG: hypothetical protein J6Y57_00285 [Lachnospiraceae bacterium]|nr:hypothetical protein [Lachnospiraceae bacterium]